MKNIRTYNLSASMILFTPVKGTSPILAVLPLSALNSEARTPVGKVGQWGTATWPGFALFFSRLLLLPPIPTCYILHLHGILILYWFRPRPTLSY